MIKRAENQKNYYLATEGATGFMLGIVFIYAVSACITVIWFIISIAMSAKSFDGDFENIESIIDVSNKGFIYISLIANQLVYLAVFFIISRIRKTDFVKASGLNNKVSVLDVLLVVVITLVSIYMLSGAADVFAYILDKINYNQMGLGIEFTTLFDFIMGFIIICVLAPLGEELIYRGMLLRGIENQMGKKPALLLSSLAFMIMHANPEQTVYQFLLGLVLGLVVLRTGKLTLAIIIHGVNNFLGLLFEFYPELYTWQTDMFDKINDLAAIAILLGATLVGAAIVYYLIKLLNPKSERIEGEEGAPPFLLSRSSFNLTYYGAVAICGFMWITTFASQMFLL